MSGTYFNDINNKKALIDKLQWMLSNRCTPETIPTKEENTILVFGSKPNGHHKGGAALFAKEKFGAIEGKSEGLAGKSYAIPVHKNHTSKMDKAVKLFVGYAKNNQDKKFFVLPIGCGSAGMNVNFVAEMFRCTINVENILIPKTFILALISNTQNDNAVKYTNYPDISTLLTKWRHKFAHLTEGISCDRDCSDNEAIETIIDMCLPVLVNFYPELKYRASHIEGAIYIKPDLNDPSLAICQITEGWYQCLKYMLGYDWYCPSLKKNDIIRCLQNNLCLNGPYFEDFDY